VIAGQGTLGVDEDLGADRGHFDAFVRALNQGDAEFTLQLAQLAAEGRLTDVASLGSMAKVAMFGDGSKVTQFLESITASTGDARRHLTTKADLVRALLLALCPGPESLRVVRPLASKLVPALYFLERIEHEDLEVVVGHYRAEEFEELARQSMQGCDLFAMSKPVAECLRDLAIASTDRNLAQLAKNALRKFPPTFLQADPDSDLAKAIRGV